MKKAIAALLISSVLFTGAMAVCAEEQPSSDIAALAGDVLEQAEEAVDNAESTLDGLNLENLNLGNLNFENLNLGSLDIKSVLGGLDPANFSLKDLNIDSILGNLKGSNFLKNLDVSKLNLQGIVNLLGSGDFLKSLGLDSINLDALKGILEDGKVKDTINSLLSKASKGESIKDALKGLMDKTEVQDMFRSLTDGKELKSYVDSLDGKNLSSLAAQGMTTLFGEKTEENSEIAEDLKNIIESGVTALKGE